MWIFFQCVAEAVAEKGARGLAEMVPGGGLMFDIAKGTWDKYRQRCQMDKMHEDVQRMVQATPEEIKEVAAKIAKQVAVEEIREQVEIFLTQIPAAVQQSLKRADDPTGTSVPANFSLQSAEDVARLLPPTLPRFKPGDALSGRSDWVLERHLSGGGFGEVWLARQVSVGFVRAVKFCKSLQHPDRDLRHEASVIHRLISQGNHPNVVPLLDAHLDGEVPWLMYEYVEGGDVGDMIRFWTKLPQAERQQKVVTALQLLARAVGRFHRLDPPIIHRDLKPANILYDRKQKQLRITDFGIGGIASREIIDNEKRGTLTNAGRLQSYLYGSYTPLYASAQQQAGAAPDPRDDVHALGVIAYQMLTCQMAEGVGPDYAHDLKGSGVEQILIDLVGRCSAQRADRRPKDAGEIAEALASLFPAKNPAKPALPVHDHAGPVVVAFETNTAPPPVADPKTEPTAARPSEEISPKAKAKPFGASLPSRRTVVWASTVGALMLMMCIACVVGWRGRQKIAPSILDATGPNGADAQRVKAVQKAWADFLKLSVVETVDLGNNVKLEMVLVPPGKFMMGTDEKSHQVELTRPFYLGKYPVTQEQYTQVMQVANPSVFCSVGQGKDTVTGLNTKRFPVETVSYLDAENFCARLAGRGGGKFKAFRLPTDAEWEYACRAGTRTPFHFGTSLNGDQANCNGNFPYGTNVKGKYLGRTCEVGNYPGNAFGLYEMHGNVGQWTDSSEVLKVRGGTWVDRAGDCAASNRGGFHLPGQSSGNVGFRVLAVPQASD